MSSSDLKDQGNASFKNGEFEKADELYSKAIDLDPTSAPLYSATRMKLDRWQDAVMDANMCIKLKPSWEKGYFRKAAAKEASHDTAEAMLAFDEGVRMSGSADLKLKLAEFLTRQRGNIKASGGLPDTSSEEEYDEEEDEDDEDFYDDEDQSESEANESDNFESESDDETEEAVELHGIEVPPMEALKTRSPPASWAAGLTPAQRAQWLLDSYRLRVQDDFDAARRQVRREGVGACPLSDCLHGVHAATWTPQAVLEDLLVFCKLAVRKEVLPEGWDWGGFLAAAEVGLWGILKWEEAHEKWGGEHEYLVALGGRSLRHTATRVYGYSSGARREGDACAECMTVAREVEGCWGELVARQGGAFFEDVGGMGAWRKLEGTGRAATPPVESSAEERMAAKGRAAARLAARAAFIARIRNLRAGPDTNGRSGQGGRGGQGAQQGGAGQAGGIPLASSWAVGLTPGQRAEWLVDCYRMRLDDEYAYGGDLGGLYDPDGTVVTILEDFLVFCKLAVRNGVVPEGWDWERFLKVAETDLQFAFEKSDAQEKWGGENIFSAMMGGRSLRFTAEVVYGTSCMAGGGGMGGAEGDAGERLGRKVSREVRGKWRGLKSREGGSFFNDVGGVGAWKHLEQVGRVGWKHVVDRHLR